MVLFVVGKVHADDNAVEHGQNWHVSFSCLDYIPIFATGLWSMTANVTSAATPEMYRIAPIQWLMELIFVAVVRGDEWGEERFGNGHGKEM